jgi:hypothetical protein
MPKSNIMLPQRPVFKPAWFAVSYMTSIEPKLKLDRDDMYEAVAAAYLDRLAGRRFTSWPAGAEAAVEAILAIPSLDGASAVVPDPAGIATPPLTRRSVAKGPQAPIMPDGTGNDRKIVKGADVESGCFSEAADPKEMCGSLIRTASDQGSSCRKSKPIKTLPVGSMLDPPVRVLQLPLGQFAAPVEMLTGGDGLPAGAVFLPAANLTLASTPCACRCSTRSRSTSVCRAVAEIIRPVRRRGH